MLVIKREREHLDFKCLVFVEKERVHLDHKMLERERASEHLDYKMLGIYAERGRSSRL